MLEPYRVLKKFTVKPTQFHPHRSIIDQTVHPWISFPFSSSSLTVSTIPSIFCVFFFMPHCLRLVQSVGGGVKGKVGTAESIPLVVCSSCSS